MVTREQDAVYRLIVTDTHAGLLVFTDRGKVYQIKCHEVPDASRQGRGLPIVHLLNLGQDEHVTEIVPVEEFGDASFLIMATRLGEVKKTSVKDFAQVRSSGLIAMNLEPGDDLVSARAASDGDDILLVTAQAQAVRFSVRGLRRASRQSGGVRGIRLAPNDHMVAMEVALPGADLLVISSNGFGKRTPLSEFTTHGRGGSGVMAMRLVERNGPIVAVRVVWPLQELMLISQKGIVIRTSVESVSRIGRITQGVTVMGLDPGDQVVSIACFNGQRGDGATQIELPTELETDEDDDDETPDDPA